MDAQAGTAPAAMDVLLPHEWYDHGIQSTLFKHGLRLPVYADELAPAIGAAPGEVPRDARGVCYVPGVGDDSCRGGRSPLADLVPRGQLYVAITPPLRSFDRTHLFGAKVVLREDGWPILVAQKDRLPDTFGRDVKECVRMARDAIEAAYPGCPFSVEGARLNQLSSGLKNVVMYVRFGGGPPPGGAADGKQVYIPVPPRSVPRSYRVVGAARRVRVRLVSDPVLGPPAAAYVVRIALDRTDEGLYEAIFDRVQDAVRDALGPDVAVFRHMKMMAESSELHVCLQPAPAFLASGGGPAEFSEALLRLDPGLTAACEPLKVLRMQFEHAPGVFA